jgi:hypothetical protein
VLIGKHHANHGRKKENEENSGEYNKAYGMYHSGLAKSKTAER